MNLKLQSIANKGEPDKERLAIKVINDTDIGDYLLLRTGTTENSPTTAVFNTLWFPHNEVKAGDLIVVYSKAGANRTKELESGKTAYFYYWGSPDALWSEDKEGVKSAVLLNAPEWDSATAEEI